MNCVQTSYQPPRMECSATPTELGGWDWYQYGFMAICVVIAFCLLWNFAVLLFGPRYRVWKQRLQGQADLAQAEAETKIAIRRAEAELEAAKHYADADVERAKGIALSIKEVEALLGGPEGYLRWKYIHMLEEQDGVSQIIYLPTEAGLPILEAGRRA
jgi:hypothetical protein